jgi:phosphomannomutase
MEQAIKKRIDFWLNGPFDEESKKQVLLLEKQDPLLLKDAFSKDLEFGTGGMRGIMAPGFNRINSFTIAKATVGVGSYFQKLNHKKHLKAVISYDNRHHSKAFALHAASILIRLGITAIVTKHLRPTPFLSFLVRYEGAHFGIMISASHNPKEYNGYKVYGKDGAQLVFPDDKNVEETIKNLTFDEIPEVDETDQEKIIFTQDDQDLSYIEALYNVAIHKKQSLDFGDSLKILYTNLHGTGLTLLPYALKQLGFKNIHFVKEQTPYDGNFPEAPSPNPEDKKALEKGLEMMEKEKYDLFLATDPDADRLACAILDKKMPTVLTGNQMAVLCLEHLLAIAMQKGQLKKHPVVISTIVSSRLLKRIADDFDAEYIDVLTGFKYIGEKIRILENLDEAERFLFGAEESYGFLYGTYARDKDGIAASCLIAEMALHYKLQGKTLIDKLDEIYKTYGLIQETTATIKLEIGPEGDQKKDRIMQSLRKESLTHLADILIVAKRDYFKKEKIELTTGKKTPIDLPQSDVMAFELEDGSEIIIRPSGTEPKIKIYANFCIESFLDIQDAKKTCKENLEKRVDYVKKELLSTL